MRLGSAILAVVCLTACSTDRPGLSPVERPVIDNTVVQPNSQSVISALISARVTHADSVRVRFHVAGSVGSDSLTPAVVPVQEAVNMPVLGLLPETHYVLRLEAFAARVTASGESVDLITSQLPADLPSYTASGTIRLVGFVVFAAGRYGLAIDRTGRVVWYRKFDGGPGLNFMAQPTGHYVARPPTGGPVASAPWVEVDVLGNVTRTFGCANGLTPRFHDLIELLDGSYWVMCDETRTMDLTSFGGVAEAHVTGTAIQHIGANGELLFHWSAFDHLSIDDLAPTDRTGASVNWTHGNALDLDADGNLLVSFRSLDEITKIDAKSGAIMWRLGGRANQFTFIGAGTPPFAHQHGARLVDPSPLLLLDNLGDPLESRAERFVLDQSARMARLVQAYSSMPPVVTEVGGSVQPLADGRALVSFGTAG